MTALWPWAAAVGGFVLGWVLCALLARQGYDFIAYATGYSDGLDARDRLARARDSR